jgi:hypothetical protein
MKKNKLWISLKKTIKKSGKKNSRKIFSPESFFID